MKKMILTVALAAATLLAAAQEVTAYKYVSPINTELLQFNLTELRDSAVNDQEYKATLVSLQKQLEQEQKNLNAEQNSLKQEKKLYSAQADFYKDRKSQITRMQKSMDNDIKEYDNLLKSIKKQYGIIEDIDNNTCDAIRFHSNMLDGLKKNCEFEQDKCRGIQKDLQNYDVKELDDTFAQLNDFLIELTDKETKLKNLAAQNKTNIEIVKTAIKAIGK